MKNYTINCNCNCNDKGLFLCLPFTMFKCSNASCNSRACHSFSALIIPSLSPACTPALYYPNQPPFIYTGTPAVHQQHPAQVLLICLLPVCSFSPFLTIYLLPTLFLNRGQRICLLILPAWLCLCILIYTTTSTLFYGLNKKTRIIQSKEEEKKKNFNCD